MVLFKLKYYITLYVKELKLASDQERSLREYIAVNHDAQKRLQNALNASEKGTYSKTQETLAQIKKENKEIENTFKGLDVSRAEKLKRYKLYKLIENFIKIERPAGHGNNNLISSLKEIQEFITKDINFKDKDMDFPEYTQAGLKVSSGKRKIGAFLNSFFSQEVLGSAGQEDSREFSDSIKNKNLLNDQRKTLTDKFKSSSSFQQIIRSINDGYSNIPYSADIARLLNGDSNPIYIYQLQKLVGMNENQRDGILGNDTINAIKKYMIEQELTLTQSENRVRNSNNRDTIPETDTSPLLGV